MVHLHNPSPREPEAGGLSSRSACAICQESQKYSSSVLPEYYRSTELLNSVESIHINSYTSLMHLIKGKGNQMTIIALKYSWQNLICIPLEDL